MSQRTNSKKKINHNQWKLNIATINRLEPLSFYIEGKIYVTPTEDKISYDRDIQSIQKQMNRNVLYFISHNENLSNQFILTYDVKTNAIKYGKKTYFTFQHHFTQNKNFILNLGTLKNKLEVSIHELMSETEKIIEQNNFKIFK